MKFRSTAFAVAAVFSLTAAPASAETFKYAFQGTLKLLDPYSLNETFTLGTLGNVYEGLTRRGPELDIQPALAESWEIVEPTRWRFNLRKGVKFHNGNDFTGRRRRVLSQPGAFGRLRPQDPHRRRCEG